MTHNDLLTWILSLPPDGTIEPRALANVLLGAEPPTSAARDALLDKARKLTAHMRITEPARRDRPDIAASPSRDATLRARTDEASAALRADALRWRERLRGRDEPPLKGLHQAETWLRFTAGPRPADSESLDPVSALGAFNDIRQQVQAARPWLAIAGPSVHRCYVHFWTPDGYHGSVDVQRESLLSEFGQWCERVERQTAIPKRSIAAAVLCDIWPGQRVQLTGGKRATMPGIPLVKLTRHTEGRTRPDMPSIRRNVITLTIDERDTSDRAFRQIRQQLQAAWLSNGTRPRRATSRQAEIISRVAAAGGPPAPYFHKSFWERISKSLSRGTSPKDWRAVARSYRRATAPTGSG